MCFTVPGISTRKRDDGKSAVVDGVISIHHEANKKFELSVCARPKSVVLSRFSWKFRSWGEQMVSWYKGVITWIYGVESQKGLGVRRLTCFGERRKKDVSFGGTKCTQTATHKSWHTWRFEREGFRADIVSSLDVSVYSSGV